jgi:hypothetical protein
MSLVATPDSCARIDLEGPDALDFLQRLSSVNVKTLRDGAGSWACFLTATGKIRSAFYLHRLSKEGFVLEMDAGKGGWNRRECLAFIDQMTFGERMTVRDRSDHVSEWIFTEEPLAAAPDSPELLLIPHGTADFGKVWTSLWGPKEAVSRWIASGLRNPTFIDRADTEAWRIERLRSFS